MLSRRSAFLCKRSVATLNHHQLGLANQYQHQYVRFVHSTDKASKPTVDSSMKNSTVSQLMDRLAPPPPPSALKHQSSSLSASLNSRAGLNDWPSPYDVSSEQSISKHIIQVWSLLEACLSHKEFPRALTLLDSLYDITDHGRAISVTTFMEALNKYLFAWSREENVSLLDVETFVMNMKGRYKRIASDGRSVAILIRTAIDSATNANDQKYAKYLRLWVAEDRSLEEILRHVDVLSIVNLKKIVREQDIPSRDIPREYRSLVLESLNTKSGRIASDEVGKELAKGKHLDSDANGTTAGAIETDGDVTWTKDIPPTLKKLGYDDLKSVDSFGMKVIRHSLLALSMKSGEAFLEKFLATVDNPEQFVDKDKQTVNFFEIYKSLTNEEDKKHFNQLLDEFNEDRQRQLEARSIEGAEESWKFNAENVKERGGLMVKNKGLNVQLWKWYQDMLPLVRAEVDLCKKILAQLNAKGELAKNSDLYKDSPAQKLRIRHLSQVAPFLSLVTPEKMTVITILEILRLNSTGGIFEGMKSARAVLSVGKAVEQEHRSDTLLEKEKNAFSGLSQGEKTQRLRRMIQRSRSTFRSNMLDETQTWPQDIRAKLGSALTSLLIKVAKVPVTGIDPRTNREVTAEVPAITHTYQYSNGTRLGVLKLHKSLLHQLGSSDLSYSVFPQSFPMLNKPKRWTTYNSGGYYFSQNTVIRSKDSAEQIAYVKTACKRNDLEQVYEGLNVLGETAWTVNERILRVMSKIWNTGEDFLAIPKDQKAPDIPPPPPRDAEPTAKRDWQRLAKKIANEYSMNRSLRCDTNYKLEIARALIGERFYFPHNLDFRGRAYPISPHFNHLGNDLSRGLLMFWEGKELGPEGLSWLKIHLANLFGHSKLPFDKRIQFVDDNISKIQESVANPYDKNGFWLAADDPWQALASMFEITEAIKLPDPSKFVSHQPVHQDGTCNGLQHYAALGGDIEGANQVNLVPSDTPKDVYAFVAALTKERLQKEKAEGNEYAEKLLNVINRKVVKQTVMTNVYGVTYIGATAQIRKQLTDYFPDKEECFHLSVYLTAHVFGAIRSLFSGAHLIQDWLSECARRVTKSVNVLHLDEDHLINQKNGKPQNMSAVIWTTPLGLPVVQPYRHINKKQVATNLQTVFISDPFEVNEVFSSRQVTAFPPNFIHSLDATHMLMSALECGKEGIAFASVHDSYWTHAASINVMNKALRDQFVKLHQVDLVTKVRNEFENRYRGNMLLVNVQKSHPAVQKILAFRKEYRKKHGVTLTLRDELVMERRRLSMLTLSDAKVVENGKNMETSVSCLTEEEIQDMLSLTSKHEHKKEKLAINHFDTPDAANVANCNVIVPFRCPVIPAKGDFDVKVVTDSKYFFS